MPMIPKVIHYCWLGGKPLPESAKKCIESWQRFCPDYEIRRWDESCLDFSLNAYCQQAYEEQAWGFVPDYLRLWIVYTYGGIYLDTDVQVLKSFDPLLEQEGFCGFEQPAEPPADGVETHAGTSEGAAGSGSDAPLMYVNFGQGFGAVAGNPLLKAHMDCYENLSYRNPDGTPNRVASPTYTTQVLVDAGLDRTSNTIQHLPGMTVYPYDYFCPKSFETGLVQVTEHSYSIHQFDASWYSADEQAAKQARWSQAQHDARRAAVLKPAKRVLRAVMGQERYDRFRKNL